MSQASYFQSVFKTVLISCVFIQCTPSDSKKTLHLYQPTHIKTLDPAFATDRYCAMEIASTYETLYEIDPTTNTIHPRLALTLPSLNSLTWEIPLKKGIYFHPDICFPQPEELTSQDVCLSLKRLIDPTMLSPNQWLLGEQLQGLKPWQEAVKKTSDVTEILSGITALDRYTVQLKFTQPDPLLLQRLCMTSSAILSSKALQFYKQNIAQHPIGTGPFMLTQFKPKSKLIWTANPTFRDPKHIDKIEVSIFTDPMPMWLSFLSQKLDLVEMPNDFLAWCIDKDLKTQPEMLKKGLVSEVVPSLDTQHVTFNMRDPLLGNNKKLRQAISLALNRQNLLQTFYQGLGSIAHGPLPPAIWGFDPNLDSPDTHYDLKKAQELVSDLPKPLHLTYAAVANAEYRKLTEFLQQSLEPLHIVLDVQTYHWPEFLEVVQNRKAQMWIMRWQADYPDPENYLQLFYSKNATNDSGFMNASYDDFYHKMVAEADKQKRLKWVQDCVRIIVQELPWSPLVHRSSLWMRSQNLRNVQTSPFALYFRRDVYFD